jgi:carboxymethylenebutenolidase
MSDWIRTASISIAGACGDKIEAYLATPDPDHDDAPRPGLVLVHHMPGFDRWSKEVARRFAVDGYDVIVPNLYSREAPGADPDDAAAASRALGGVPDERFVGDCAGAVSYLRSRPLANGRVGILGHCSGGRQAVLGACTVKVDAVVDCYGAFVVDNPPEDHFMAPLGVSGLEDRLPELSCPLLGLFGADDAFPSPDNVARLDQLLTQLGKEHEFHLYEGAGHGFFATDRYPLYRVQASLDGYARIAAFFDKHLVRAAAGTGG